MKTLSRNTFFAAAVAVATLASALNAQQMAEEYRNWTNSKGQSIEAALIESSPVTVTLKMKSGREYPVKVLDLSDADIEYIKKWEAKKAELSKIADEPKPQTETVMTTPGRLMFSEEFASLSDDWKRNMGDWATVDGVLTGAEKPSDDHGAVFKKRMPFKNAIIEFSFKLDGCKGISLSIDDDEDHVCRMSIAENGFSVQKDDHDHEGPDERVPFERREATLSSGEWHTARIEILGEEMLGQVGEEIGFGAHELIATEKTKFGFTVAGQSAQFKNLKVWEALPNEDWEKTRKRLERKRD